MPERENPAEAVAAAAEAIEKLVDDDKNGGNKTPSVGPLSDHKIRSMAALILACASLLATLGTFIKTCDHSVTENSYNTLSDSIKTLNENQQKNHDDLVALHGYLDGLTHAPLVAPPIPPSVDAGATITVVPSATATSTAHPPPVGSTAMNPKDAGLITFAIVAPPLPSIHSAGVPVAPPPFAQAMAPAK